MNRSIQKRALALALVVAIGSAHAQSTTGSIVGSVGQGNGTRVVVENNSGLSRECRWMRAAVTPPVTCRWAPTR
ncbi:hypothetical protein G8D19_08970 [Xanthomonas vesicatoria]|nr:hypothetical protein [Xanthomonas vesicatoria]